MTAYYNEIDLYAAEWLRNLIREGLIAPGDVDERSIADVRPDDLKGYTQCHFFAGIGGWSLALRMAGWSDERAVWTGSCPCQPFSDAGKQAGADDERHLWPEFRRLIAVRRPAVVFGEQVASRLGRGWLAGVRADLEALGYGVGAADLCAAGVGAPHIRQRLWWVADNQEHGRGEGGTLAPRGDGGTGVQGDRAGFTYDRSGGGVADGIDAGLERHAGNGADGRKSGRVGTHTVGSASPDSRDRWSGIWIPCADGKARRIEPGLEPLAHGIPNRVGRLRAYGNAIVPQVAAAFIRAYAGSC